MWSTAGTWAECTVRISPSGISFHESNSAKSDTVSASNLYSSLSVTECRIGGLDGYIDEFYFRDQHSDSLLTQPVKARLNIVELGGFGSGSLGNVSIFQNCIMNTAGELCLVASSYFFIIGTAGKYGSVNLGSEIMILNENGEYCFRTVAAKSDAVYLSRTGSKEDAIPITLSSPLPSTFTGNSWHAIVIPHFNTLTINAGVTVSPAAWNGTSGGIVAFRCKGNCTVLGNIITSGKGRTRDDMMQLTHAKLIDNFIQNKGGGIFITCGGTFSAPSTARLGASWSGDQKGGVRVSRSAGKPGGAGYGGAGGSDVDNGALGGAGGVGGGGGGADRSGYYGGAAGTRNRTGGYGNDGGNISLGGTQGVTSGGNTPDNSSGGAGAGGNSVTRTDAPFASSGANIILITSVLHVDLAAISTGGAGGGAGGHAAGGGGTGFCYIACKEAN